MSSLSPLSYLGKQEKWFVKNAQIYKIQKQPSKLKNLLDFGSVIKFAVTQFQGKNCEDVQGYMNILSIKYAHINEAIDRQNIITRLFVRIVLFIKDFNSDFDRLQTIYKNLPSRLVINESITSNILVIPPVSSKQVLLSPKKIRAGFTNGGNTCFIAAALHCLNTIADVLPKNIEQDVKKKTNESEEIFIKRKKLIVNIFELLAKSNQNTIISSEEMNQLRQVWFAYDSSIPPIYKPGDAGVAYNKLLMLLSSPLELTYIKSIEDHRSCDISTIKFFIPSEKENKQKPFAQGCSIKENICILNKYELRAVSAKAPLFVPIQISRSTMEKNNCTIPSILKFANSTITYELASCIIDKSDHAYCYVKNQDQTWMKHDDHHINFYNLEEIESDIQDYVTLLVYRQQKR